MEEQLVEQETLQLAKKLNFKDYEQDDIYPEHLYCTQTILAKWLREEHDIFIPIWNNASGYSYFINKASNGTTIDNLPYKGNNDGGMWDTYEEALEAGIEDSLKRLNKQ